jgi:hypothetical protein
MPTTLDALEATLPAAPTKPATNGHTPQQPTNIDDAALLEKAKAAANGAKFAALWDGDTSAYAGDESAADQALCNLLAFWTGCDAIQMDRLFRRSGLMRDKWERKARAEDASYGSGTIRRAIEGCTDTYSPGGTVIIDTRQNGHAAAWPVEPTSSVEPTSIDAVIATFQRWLHLPDVTPLLAVLATVAANMLPGDPTWLLVVGPPSGGKTEILQAIRRVPKVFPAATLTEAALLSGTPQKDKSKAAHGGLLLEIGGFGIILCKDFGSVLSMNRDTRAQLLAALREVYDGEWTRHLGTDGGKTLHWEGHVGLIAGCTGEIDRHHAVIAAMGERFLTCRLPELDAIKLATRALDHVGDMPQMRTELSAAVAGLFTVALVPAALTGDDKQWLAQLSTLVVSCRSAVDRDGYTREVELIPGAEAPARLATSLARLLSGLQALGVTHKEARRVVASVAMDSMPAIRKTAFDFLATQSEPVVTDAVALAANYPKNTMQRTLEDLHAYDVVERGRKATKKKPADPSRITAEEEPAANAQITWALSAWARELDEAINAHPKC